MQNPQLECRPYFSLFSLCCGVLAILVTIHADIFEQEENPTAALATKTFDQLRSSTEEVSLASLLSEDTLSNRGSDENGPLYVLVLDVSGSMTEQQISPREINMYLDSPDIKRLAKRLNGLSAFLRNKGYAAVAKRLMRILPKRDAQTTGFAIAKCELARHIRAIPIGSRLALWSFGHSTSLKLPSQSIDRWMQVEETKGGGENRYLAYDALATLMPTDSLSNFEELLDNLALVYEHVIVSSEEAHFVIVSDFDHDIGGGRILRSPVREKVADGKISLWRSRYRVSIAAIADRFAGMAQPGKTFHLSAIRGARPVSFDILPICGASMEWYSYRTAHPYPGTDAGGSGFLRAYAQSDEEIPFHFVAGRGGPNPTYLDWTGWESKNCKLELSLASVVGAVEEIPFKIRVGCEGGEGGGVLWTGGPTVPLSLDGLGSRIEIAPLRMLSQDEAWKYRLLFSLEDEKEGDRKAPCEKTFAVPIRYCKQMSETDAWIMALTVFFVLLFLFLTIWNLRPRQETG